MPKTEYNSNPSNIPLFKRPFDGGRITRLEDDVDDLYNRLDGIDGRLESLVGTLEEIRAYQVKEGTKEAVASKGAGAAVPPPPPPPPPATPEVKQRPQPQQPQSQPQPQPQQQPPQTQHNGSSLDIGRAYVWWDAQSRTWVPCTDIWAAKQAGNEVYHPKWAWLDAQHRLVRFLSPEEIRRYCP